MAHVRHAFNLKKETLKMQWTAKNQPEAFIAPLHSIEWLVKLFSAITGSLIVKPDEGDS
jgi:hypothetical protein